MHEPHAIASQRIEIRRADILVDALGAEVGIAVIVTVDEDDVGLGGGWHRRVGSKWATTDEPQTQCKTKEQFHASAFPKSKPGGSKSRRVA